MKRVLFLANRKLIAKIGTLIPPDHNLFVCYATSTTPVASLIDDGAVDLVIFDLTSIPQDDIDHIIGSPWPEDVDATAEYQEPKVDVPNGVEFYAFNPFEKDATQKLLAKILE